MPVVNSFASAALTSLPLHNARLNAELLLAGSLGLKRLDLYLQHDRPLKADELADFKARLLRRAKREPLQYIEGHAAFRDLTLRVDRRVLIPRPETETLVQAVLDWAAGRDGDPRPAGPAARAVGSTACSRSGATTVTCASGVSARSSTPMPGAK